MSGATPTSRGVPVGAIIERIGMPSNMCWGVEIGAGAVKALKLELDGETPKVRDFAVLNHPKVLSTPELDTSEAIRLTLGALTGQHDMTGAALAVSVPGHQSFARFAKLPPVEPKKVPDIVKFEAVQQIPFPLEEVEWDYQTFVSPDSPDVEVGIFAVTRPRMMELLGQMGEVGLTPEIATLGPVAVYNALAYDLEFTEKTPGTIILDIGTTATDLIIAEAGRVWVRTFPLGGHQFTDALVTSFKLSYSKAERLKREAEQTKHARHVFQAMRPVFTDLVQEVQRSIGYYQSVHAGADLKRLIGLGNTFRLPGLRKYLKQQLHMDIYRIEGYKRLEGPEGRESEFTDAALNLATAYGLALQGLGYSTLEANVMPVQVVRDTMWRRKRVFFGAAAGLAAAATAGWFVRPLMDMTALNSVTEPAAIQKVVNEGKRLKAEAEQAGVLGDSTPDLTASKLIDLLADRGLYAEVVNDIEAMVADVRGSDLFADGGEFRIALLDTEYEKAEEEKKSPSKGRGRGGSDPRDPRAAAGGGGGLLIVQPQYPTMMNRPVRKAAADFPTEMKWQGEKIDLKTKRRINVTLEFATDNPDAEDVAIAVVNWLRDHQARADSSYVIALAEDDEDVYEETAVSPPMA
ncbi:MAG TPA: type IV pilus assembly protein PilM, partial [Phycisphaerales bacterium]|nr:type IV pilus assembly protein PilM [Phycisphaerales bacterium]